MMCEFCAIVGASNLDELEPGPDQLELCPDELQPYPEEPKLSSIEIDGSGNAEPQTKKEVLN